MMDPEADEADSNGIPDFDVVAEPGEGVLSVGEPSSATELLRLALIFMISSPSGYNVWLISLYEPHDPHHVKVVLYRVTKGRVLGPEHRGLFLDERLIHTLG